MTEEIKNKNLLLFLKKLEENNINISLINEDLKQKLLNCPFLIGQEEGSLLNNILRVLTPYAIHLNNILPEQIKCNNQSLIKLCLISNLSKCTTFIKEGDKYIYNKDSLAMKMGMKSLAMGLELGMTFTPEEVEALSILDRDNDDQAKYFASPLSTILKMSLDLTNLQIRNKI